MILEKQKEAQVLTAGDGKSSIAMSLDLDSAQVLMEMLSKNLYSDPIGSTIRECASNALDSHRRVGQTLPIIVAFGRNREDNYEFSVEDFGSGLDDKDVENIISKYGKSTKRTEKDSLGMMGLGFKAPLAYSSSFYFTCRKDGIERKYMMYEGEDSNTIDLLYEAPTTEKNGVKIIVPVKFHDNYTFSEKMKEQLAYFENVYFHCTAIDNTFKIHRNDVYQYSELTSDRNLHICLDNVYYPIDFAKLGIQPIRIPVGLRISLSDGVYPVPSRESIRYTPEAKQTILNKIAELSDVLVEKYNSSITEHSDIKAIFQYYSERSRKITLLKDEIDISSLLQYSKIGLKKPVIKDVKLIDVENLALNKHYIIQEYDNKFTLYNGFMRDSGRSYFSTINPLEMNSYKYYKYAGIMGGNMKSYIKTQVPSHERFFFIKKRKSYKLGSKLSNGYDTYFQILDLGSHPKTEWRQRIKEFQHIQNLFLDKVIDLDSIQIPQAWLDARKKKSVKLVNGVKKLKLKGEIIGKQACDLERYVDGKNCKFVSQTEKLEDIENKPYLTVYANHSENEKLDDLYSITKKQKIRYMTFSQRELNVLEKAEIHNLIPYSKFMEGKNKPFKRLVTSYVIFKLTRKCQHLFNNRNNLKTVSVNLLDKLDKLADYTKNNYVDTYHAEKIYAPMVAIAEQHNLFDEEIYHIYKEVNALIEKLTFLNPMMGYTHINDDLMLAAIADLFKYYRVRIDYTRYNLKLNDEEALEELTEDKIEELTN
jgi:hypothetical protein